MTKKTETRGRPPTDLPTKQVRVPILYEQEVKDFIEFLKYRHRHRRTVND